MRCKIPSKVIISFKDLDQANGFVRAIEEWFRQAGAGGDAAILISDRHKGVGMISSGMNCGIVGHDVELPLCIEHDIPKAAATEALNKRNQYDLDEMLKSKTGKLEAARLILEALTE